MFKYYHGETTDGHRFTIASLSRGKKQVVGVSLCSEKDNFRRLKGRLISSGRVQKYLDQNNVTGLLSAIRKPKPVKGVTLIKDESFSNVIKEFQDRTDDNSILPSKSKEDLVKYFNLID